MAHMNRYLAHTTRSHSQHSLLPRDHRDGSWEFPYFSVTSERKWKYCKVGSWAALVSTALDPFHLTRATSFDTLPTLVYSSCHASHVTLVTTRVDIFLVVIHHSSSPPVLKYARTNSIKKTFLFLDSFRRSAARQHAAHLSHRQLGSKSTQDPFYSLVYFLFSRTHTRDNSAALQYEMLKGLKYIKVTTV